MSILNAATTSIEKVVPRLCFNPHILQNKFSVILPGSNDHSGGHIIHTLVSNIQRSTPSIPSYAGTSLIETRISSDVSGQTTANRKIHTIAANLLPTSISVEVPYNPPVTKKIPTTYISFRTEANSSNLTKPNAPAFLSGGLANTHRNMHTLASSKARSSAERRSVEMSGNQATSARNIQMLAAPIALPTKTTSHKSPPMTYVAVRNLSTLSVQATESQQKKEKVHYFAGPGPQPLYEALSLALKIKKGSNEKVVYVYDNTLAELHQKLIDHLPLILGKNFGHFSIRMGHANDLVLSGNPQEAARAYRVMERDAGGSLVPVTIASFCSSTVPSLNTTGASNVTWLKAENDSRAAEWLMMLAKEYNIV